MLMLTLMMLMSMLMMVMMSLILFSVCLVVNMLMHPNEPDLHASLPSLRLSLLSYISKWCHHLELIGKYKKTLTKTHSYFSKWCHHLDLEIIDKNTYLFFDVIMCLKFNFRLKFNMGSCNFESQASNKNILEIPIMQDWGYKR